MVFLNSTDMVGEVIVMMTTNLTGSTFLTFFLIVLILFLLTIMFKLPLEIGTACILPLVILLSVYMASFIPILSMLVLFIALYFSRKF